MKHTALNDLIKKVQSGQNFGEAFGEIARFKKLSKDQRTRLKVSFDSYVADNASNFTELLQHHLF